MAGTIAFVTTCKGRLHHLEQTLPLMVGQGADEVIVVDYGCPDRIGDWVEARFPAVRVVHVSDDPAFCAARARNLGAAAAVSDWLVFIDGDVETAPGWVEWMRGHLEPGCFYRAAPIAGERDRETWGTAICRRADFEAIGGYDEAFSGWGGEDADLYLVLAGNGVAERDYPHRFVRAIPHGDDQRAGWAGMRDKDEKLVVNACYREAKMQMHRILGGGARLPLGKRHAMMAQIGRELRTWFDAGAPKPLTLRYSMKGGGVQRPSSLCLMQSELTVTIHVQGIPAKEA